MSQQPSGRAFACYNLQQDVVV